MKLVKSILIVVGFAAVLRADVPDPDPEIERKSFKIADGFEINLFASDPMIQKPIEMNWDTKNRLWVASSETYPQLKPGQAPNDKIFILEDTTGSGKADKSTLFADGLFIPNAVIPGDGGAYVTNSTEILFLKDSKGTGKTDTRRVVLSGFGTEDTHHIVHTLRFGVDGKLYFLQSLYIHSHLETPYGPKTLLASGVWRFDTRTLELGVYSRGLVNPWGIIWDRWGQTFETDGAGFQGINYSFPGAAFESAMGIDRVLPGMNPRSPKYCSEEILSGRHIPENYDGDILTNDFRANRIVRFKLSDNAAGYTSRQLRDFLTSTDVAFRPVDIKMGPDGAIYIADWYNPIIQHGEVDFRDPRRDHVHGRIWRVTAKDRPLVARPKIDGASIPELLDLLKAPEDYTRHQARLAFREMDPKQVLPALKEWVSKITSRDAQADHDRLEALWTCENLNQVDATLLERVLKSDEPRARTAAVRVAGNWAGQLPDALKLIAPMTDDSYPRVRLEAVRALAAIPTLDSIRTATRVLDKPMDPVLDYALWLTCNDLSSVWLPAFEQGKLGDWPAAQRNYALRAVKSPVAAKVLIGQLRDGHMNPSERRDAINLIADIGDKQQATALFDLALSSNADRPALLSALLDMSARRVPAPDDAKRISELADTPEALRLAGAWNLTSLRPKLIQLATTDSTPDPLRAGAIDGLARIGGRESTDVLQKLSAPPTPPKVRRMALSGLAVADLKQAVKSAAQMIGAGDDNPGEILAALLGREGAARSLVSSLQGVKVPRDTAKLALRYLQGSTTQDAKLMAIFSEAAGSSTGPVKLTPEQMKQAMDEVLAKGDAARGELAFRRPETNCYQCHAIAGTGGWLAPDLSSIGATAQLDYLINSVLDPNKDIKDGYDGYMVVTKSGDAYSGIKVLQDSSHLVLRDNDHQALAIPLTEVKAQRSIGSLMPVGLTDAITHQEFLDLIKFLSDLGKPGPYGPTTAQYIRRWQLSDEMSKNANWTSAYSLVSGILPNDVLVAKGKSIVYARGQIDVTAPGKVRLVVNDPRGLKLWVDQKPAEVSAEIPLDLPRGIHDLTFAIDPATRSESGLRVEVADSLASSAHAQAVGGR
jgi:putative heme-binding domain-containing protein